MLPKRSLGAGPSANQELPKDTAGGHNVEDIMGWNEKKVQLAAQNLKGALQQEFGSEVVARHMQVLERLCTDPKLCATDEGKEALVNLLKTNDCAQKLKNADSRCGGEFVYNVDKKGGVTIDAPKFGAEVGKLYAKIQGLSNISSVIIGMALLGLACALGLGSGRDQHKKSFEQAVAQHNANNSDNKLHCEWTVGKSGLRTLSILDAKGKSVGASVAKDLADTAMGFTHAATPFQRGCAYSGSVNAAAASTKISADGKGPEALVVSVGAPVSGSNTPVGAAALGVTQSSSQAPSSSSSAPAPSGP